MGESSTPGVLRACYGTYSGRRDDGKLQMGGLLKKDKSGDLLICGSCWRGPGAGGLGPVGWGGLASSGGLRFNLAVLCCAVLC